MYEGEDGFPAAKRRRLESGGEYIDTTHPTTDFWNDGAGTAVGCSSQSLQLFAGSGSSLMANDAMDCDDPFAYSMDQYVSQDMIDVADKDETNEDSRMNVCFGVIIGIAATYERQASGDLPTSFSVQLNTSTNFNSKDFDFVRGQIHTEYAQMLEGMMDENSLDLHIICTVDARPATKKRGRSHIMWPCTLDITVYGPFELFDEIGNWFRDYEVHLQDPRVCHLDTLYCNPQRLSSVPPWSLVSQVVSQRALLAPREVPERPDFLDILSSQVDLEETAQPLAIHTILQSLDVYDGSFLNTVSRFCQNEEPLNFFGGIIADPMGFGKTLTMISLVAMDKEREELSNMDETEAHKPDVTATLVIIPPPLIGPWEEQLSDHVVEGQLVYRRHHGKNRIAGIQDLASVNIVLTTYHTVSADWKSGPGLAHSPIFAVRWKRIVLDEAHFIRNVNARMARAVCDLEAISRWAVTGTPIQNRLGDLASLLKFIRPYPYTDPKKFDADVSQPWKSGEDEEAVNRLKQLSACLLLRRPKGAIDLPARRDLQRPVCFSQEEREKYERIRQQTTISIDEAFGTNTARSRSLIYVNVLQRIESLRLFCNLGVHYRSRLRKPSSVSTETEQWSANAQRMFNLQRQINPIVCTQCSSALGLTDTFLDDASNHPESAQFTSCLQFTCSDCMNKKHQSGKAVTCGCKPPCSVAPVSTSGVDLEEVEDVVCPSGSPAFPSLPSKIKALLEDLKEAPSDVKCVVFSTWRLTLDLITRGLDAEGIRSIRFDGKVPQKDRQSVLKSFSSDPSIRVMLLTLSCGAVGLTLTAASRAYLMEPHWNPTLEEQALARIHRLGQTREVETVRFYIQDSFEEEVMKIQESKKELAGVLLSPHDREKSNGSLGTLEKLRSFL
ncbi:SNF2 family N-terminal domain-containing protein [Hypoxylon argillaceum]|nr:SNF2 family N-terminal domain-containing protein [Hypoxylon argillaceum]